MSWASWLGRIRATILYFNSCASLFVSFGCGSITTEMWPFFVFYAGFKLTQRVPHLHDHMVTFSKYVVAITFGGLTIFHLYAMLHELYYYILLYPGRMFAYVLVYGPALLMFLDMHNSNVRVFQARSTPKDRAGKNAAIDDNDGGGKEDGAGRVWVDGRR